MVPSGRCGLTEARAHVGGSDNPKKPGRAGAGRERRRVRDGVARAIEALNATQKSLLWTL